MKNENKTLLPVKKNKSFSENNSLLYPINGCTKRALLINAAD